MTSNTICAKCNCEIDEWDSSSNLFDEIVCNNCINDEITISIEDERLETFLWNTYEFWYIEWSNILWEWEGRIVYDLESLFNVPLICKYPKQNREVGVNYQCFVENHIYKNVDDDHIKDNFLAKIYTPGYLIGKNSCTFMEKCHVLDECFFSWIDIRDKKTFDTVVDFESNKINYVELDKLITKAIDDTVRNEWFIAINIENYDVLFRVFKFFTMVNFTDWLWEYWNEHDINMDKIIEYVNEALELFIPTELSYLQLKFDFNYYDIYLWTQWGISQIDWKLKLIDYWMWVKSKSFFQIYN